MKSPDLILPRWRETLAVLGVWLAGCRPCPETPAHEPTDSVQTPTAELLREIASRSPAAGDLVGPDGLIHIVHAWADPGDPSRSKAERFCGVEARQLADETFVRIAARPDTSDRSCDAWICEVAPIVHYTDPEFGDADVDARSWIRLRFLPHSDGVALVGIEEFEDSGMGLQENWDRKRWIGEQRTGLQRARCIPPD